MAKAKQVANIHDAFFKEVMRDRQMARQFLREHLPEDVAQLLVDEAPRLQPGSFVDPRFRQYHTDVLFRARLRGGGTRNIRAGPCLQ